MKRIAQPISSAGGQHALDQYRQVLQRAEDLSPVTTCNYLSDLRQFIAWCEVCWRERQEERNFTPQYATLAQVADLSPHDLHHRMAKVVLLHRLAQIMEYDSLDTTMLYIHGTRQDLQQNVEKIAWIQVHLG